MTRREGDERGGREEGGEKNMAGKKKKEEEKVQICMALFLFFITPLLSVALPALTRLGLLH